MTNFRLAVVGGGNMGAALVGGLLGNGWAAADLAVVEVAAERRDTLTTMFPGVAVSATVPPCDAAVIAVKPHDAAGCGDRGGRGRGAAACCRSPPASRSTTLQAGVRRRSRGRPVDAQHAGAARQGRRGDRAVDRSPPTTTSTGPRSILGAVGTVVRVPEPLLDAVTGLTGSGPAYLFLVAEALIDAGVLAGLTRPVADALVRQLFVGSAAMLAEYGDPVALRAMVTSPGGTTAAGLRVLEEHGIRSALLEAVLAATERSQELGVPLARATRFSRRALDAPLRLRNFLV